MNTLEDFREKEKNTTDLMGIFEQGMFYKEDLTSSVIATISDGKMGGFFDIQEFLKSTETSNNENAGIENGLETFVHLEEGLSPATLTTSKTQFKVIGSGPMKKNTFFTKESKRIV